MFNAVGISSQDVPWGWAVTLRTVVLAGAAILRAPRICTSTRIGEKISRLVVCRLVRRAHCASGLLL